MSVKIIKSKSGDIFAPTKKEGLLCLAVEEIQENKGVSLDGKFANPRSRRIAFIFRTKEQFDAIFADMKVSPVADMELPGIVAVKEQLIPFSTVNPMNGIKYPNAQAKVTGLMCTVGGKPVYRDTLYTTDETIEDILVKHDNNTQIQDFVRTMNKPATATLTNASPEAPKVTGRRRNATA